MKAAGIRCQRLLGMFGIGKPVEEGGVGMRRWVILLAGVLLGCHATTETAAGKYLSYDQLVKKIEQGAIKTISLGPYRRIEGTLIEEGSERAFNSYYPSKGNKDPFLMQLLRRRNVEIDVRTEDTRSPWYLLPTWIGCFTFLFPVIMLVLLLRVNSKVKRIWKHLEPILAAVPPKLPPRS
jgi:ATP-dependent Zn protease